MTYLTIHTITILITNYITKINVPMIFAWNTGLTTFTFTIILTIINTIIKTYIVTGKQIGRASCRERV